LSPRRRRPAILSLHDVVDRGWFHRVLQELSERSRFVDLGSLVAAHVRGEDPGPFLALTFDDGYKSIRTVVEPVCTELAIPFTTFVCGDVVTGGGVPWFDRVGLVLERLGIARAAHYWRLNPHFVKSGRALINALKQYPFDEVLAGLDLAEANEGIDSDALRSRYMDIDDLREVARNPLATVGSHSHRHPILTNLPHAQLDAEIKAGLRAIQSVCPRVTLFAYPNGQPEDFDPHVMKLLQEQGILGAVTTIQRSVRPDDDPLQLPRLGVSEGDSGDWIELKWALPWPALGTMRERSVRRKFRQLRREASRSMK